MVKGELSPPKIRRRDSIDLHATVAVALSDSINVNNYAVFWSGPSAEFVEKVAPIIARLWKRLANDDGRYEGESQVQYIKKCESHNPTLKDRQ